MESGDYDPPLAPGLLVAQSWQATVILGAVTLILGLIVSFHPGGSLNVVAGPARHPDDLFRHLPSRPDIRPRGKRTGYGSASAACC
jgi:hypothetical protein